MRPRTKSIVNSGEYFRQESAYAPSMHSDDDWMEIAMRGSANNKAAHLSVLPPTLESPMWGKGRKRIGSNESNFSNRSTLHSWDENDPDFDMDDDDDDEDDHRRRRCSHTRRISFDDDVAVVTIPSRDSFDAEYKRRVWYSMEDLSRMRELD